MRGRGALVLVALLAVPAPAQETTRVRLGRVELEGPLRRALLALPGGAATEIGVPLSAGERRLLEVPLAPAPEAPDAEPEVTVEGTGAARFSGWSISDVELLEERWSRLPLGLRMRPGPGASGADAAGAGSSAAALLLASAAFLLALRWRRRSGAALLAGTVGAVATLAVAASSPAAPAVLWLLEGDGASGRWLSVLVARGRLALAPTPALHVTTDPRRARLTVRVEEDAEGALAWVLEAPHATLRQTELADLPPDALTRTKPNRLGALARCWVREPEGTWTRRGPWAQGEVLPPARPGPGEPPGWLNPALPLGAGVLIGERASAGRPGAVAWVRVVGF